MQAARSRRRWPDALHLPPHIALDSLPQRRLPEFSASFVPTIRTPTLNRTCLFLISVSAALHTLAASQAHAAGVCPATYDQLNAALKASVKASGGPSNGGLDNNMWATLVTRDGTACAVAYSGGKWDDQWPGSRVISAQKANTANGFSVAGAAFSTAQMYAASQPGGFLYGIVASNPVATDAAYAGDADQYGTNKDPLNGKRMGGVNVFGGGLALYNDSGVVGGLGLSGDTSCADHNVAWRVRKKLGLDRVKAGPAGLRSDGIIYDIGPTGSSSSGFGHPKCAAKEEDIAKDIGSGGNAAIK
jgi:uncharacterized protein GlcG (DUF336 family)